MQPEQPTVFQRIGPEPISFLAMALYRGIAGDARIRGMFSDDLSPTSEAVRDMREFLTQFFGGPGDYSVRKGHPRLRARHMRFTITPAARDAWLGHALAALAETERRHQLDPATVAEMRRYFEHASAFMINQVDDQSSDASTAESGR
jgi:hemoglobin